MDFSGLNSNPVVFDTTANVRKALPLDEEDDEVMDEVPRAPAPRARIVRVHEPQMSAPGCSQVDTMEIFDLIRDIKDPEHDGGACSARALVRVLCAGTARRASLCYLRCAMRWFHDTTIRLSLRPDARGAECPAIDKRDSRQCAQQDPCLLHPHRCVLAPCALWAPML
jgi:hypothetical protein